MKKLLLLIVLSFICLNLTTSKVFAADTGLDTKAQQGLFGNQWYVEDPLATGQQLINAVQNPDQINNWTYRLDFLTGTMSQLTMAMGGPIFVDKNGNPISANNGVAGLLASGIDSLIKTPPASSIDYVAYELNNLKVPGSPQTAYAAGSSGYGFKSLNFILPFWTVARNLAYIVFAIVFIVVGMMIMFRIKIDPKTAASIQNALPKMIFALILVTFSYAIAGFLIDIMYVLMALVFSIFAHLPNYKGVLFTPAIFEQKILVQNNSIFDFYLQGPGVAANVNAAIAIFKVVFFWFANPSNINVNSTLLDKALGLVFAPIGAVAGGIAGILAFFIIMIMIIWALLRTWLSLLGAYINILLGIISAPILLMMDAIPGQNQFVNWLRSMMTNLLVFPLVTIMLLLGAALTESQANCSAGETFIPPLVGSGCGGPFLALIGLGIILTTPRVINILQEALKAPAFKYGNAWMENLQPVKSTAAGIIQPWSQEAGTRGRIYGVARSFGLVR